MYLRNLQQTPETYPKYPQKNKYVRNSFINRWLRVWGLFQGSVEFFFGCIKKSKKTCVHQFTWICTRISLIWEEIPLTKSPLRVQCNSQKLLRMQPEQWSKPGIPLCWLVSTDPCNGILQSLYKWAVQSPMYSKEREFWSLLTCLGMVKHNFYSYRVL